MKPEHRHGSRKVAKQARKCMARGLERADDTRFSVVGLHPCTRSHPARARVNGAEEGARIGHTKPAG
jgi:hypothetical protein